MPELASSCTQIIMTVLANYTLPDRWLNHQAASGDIANSQRTLAKNLISVVCYHCAAGNLGGRIPKKHQTIKSWVEHPNNSCKERDQQIKDWVIKHFGPATQQLAEQLEKDSANKKSSGRAKGHVNPKTTQRVGNNTRFGMTMLETDIDQLQIVNMRDNLTKKLKQSGVSSVEELHARIQANKEVDDAFIRSTPLPMAIIYNALLRSPDPKEWLYHCPKWQMDMCTQQLKKWKAQPLPGESEEDSEEDEEEDEDEEEEVMTTWKTMAEEE